MKIEVFDGADAVAREEAKFIAAEARAAVAARGRFVMAVSGGHTPWQMLRALADEAVPWESVHVVQADERIAPGARRGGASIDFRMGAIHWQVGAHDRHEDLRGLGAAERTPEKVRFRAGQNSDRSEGITRQEIK